MPVTLSSLYVAAYRNPDSSNIARDWLPVLYCTSTVGAPNARLCGNGVLLRADWGTSCYVKLDIEIAYTRIGSVYNPQPVISAIIFHYQVRISQH